MSVTWKKDGQQVSASHQYNLITSDSSSILEVLYSDSLEAGGKYFCAVDNGAGSDRCDAHVLILGKQYLNVDMCGSFPAEKNTISHPS